MRLLHFLCVLQYDAVYVQESEDGPRLVLQTTSVKRRFQEFLNLQNRLEENPMFRSALKGTTVFTVLI